MADFLHLYTQIHTGIALAGILSGLFVMAGLLGGRQSATWAAVFLGTTIVTSVTGFGFPFNGLLPSHLFGVLSLILLALAVVALYKRRLAGRWRVLYIVTSVFALYLNVFVAVVQTFQKIPAMNALAPTQSELPFVLAQAAVLLLFTGIGAAAVFLFKPHLAAATPLTRSKA